MVSRSYHHFIACSQCSLIFKNPRTLAFPSIETILHEAGRMDTLKKCTLAMEIHAFEHDLQLGRFSLYLSLLEGIPDLCRSNHTFLLLEPPSLYIYIYHLVMTNIAMV